MTNIDKLKKKAIIVAYYYRLKSKKIVVDINELYNKFLLLPDGELNDFFSNIMKSNNDTIVEALKQLKIKVTYSENSLNNEQTQTLHSPSITEFEKNNNNYLKFKNKKGNIKIFKNFGDTETTVSSILKKEKDNKRFSEIPLVNSKGVDTSKSSKVQTVILKEMEKQFENADLLVSMKENLYVAKKDDDDTILTVDNNNGHYTVKQLTQKPYKKEQNSLNTKGKSKVFTNPNTPKLVNDEELVA